MIAYRDPPPLRQQIVWCKPADETVVAVVVCVLLASLAGVATAHLLATHAWLAAVAFAVPCVSLVALAARFLNRDIVVLSIEGSTITSRALLGRRRRARAQLDAMSEIRVTDAVVVGITSAGTEYSQVSSAHAATEYEVRVCNDAETTLVAGIRHRAAADDIANWIRAAREAES